VTDFCCRSLVITYSTGESGQPCLIPLVFKMPNLWVHVTRCAKCKQIRFWPFPYSFAHFMIGYCNSRWRVMWLASLLVKMLLSFLARSVGSDRWCCDFWGLPQKWTVYLFVKSVVVMCCSRSFQCSHRTVAKHSERSALDDVRHRYVFAAWVQFLKNSK